MPHDLTWRHILGTGLFTGALTISLFIEGLSFRKTPLDAPSKVGILTASAVAGRPSVGCC